MSAGRLRRHLAGPGHFAVLSPVDPQSLALYRGGGTTLGAGHALAAEADALVAAGLARWTGSGRGRRLISAEAPEPRALAVEEIEGRAVVVDERESPLAWLYRRKDRDGRPQLSDAEFAAGERFRADLTRAQMLPRVTANWDAAIASGARGPVRDPAAASDAAVAARQRVRDACALLGPELSGLLIDVCGFLKGLDLVERERGWPARSAKIVLRLGLSRLAEHYGLSAGAVGPERSGGASVWRAEGARPRL